MYFCFAEEKMEEAKLNNTKEIVRASEKYVLWGGRNGNHGLVLSFWGEGCHLGFVFRPNLYLIPDMDTRCSPNSICPSGKIISVCPDRNLQVLFQNAEKRYRCWLEGIFCLLLRRMHLMFLSLLGISRISQLAL